MTTRSILKVSDEIWMALALLHQRYPERSGFSGEEIAEQIRQEFKDGRPAIFPYIYQHAVAAKTPKPGRYRIVHLLEDGRRRLFRPGDPYHPDREGSPFCPEVSQIPPKYYHLLEWYRKEYALQPYVLTADHPLMAILGIGDSGLTDVSEKHDLHLAGLLPEKVEAKNDRSQ